MPEKWELEKIAKAQEFLDVDKPTANYDLIYNPSAEELVGKGFHKQGEDDIVLSPNDVEILLETGVLKIDVNHGEYEIWLRVCGHFPND